MRLRYVREPARRRAGLHDDRAEEQLRRDQARRCDRVRSEVRPRWPHDAGVGRDRLRRRERQTYSPLPMYADDPLPALSVPQSWTIIYFFRGAMPVMRTTLERMIPSPASVPNPKGSSSSRTPNRSPKTGTSSVTVSVLVGPTFSMSRK